MLLAPVSHTLVPQKAEASVPIHCTPGLDLNCVKEFVLDLLTRQIVSVLIRSLTNSIIAWIQGDDGANVGYIGNFEESFKHELNVRAGEFLDQLAAGVNLCGNIGPYLQISLRNVQGFQQSLGCSVTDIVDNVDSFFEDFINGGWRAFIRTSMVPKNQPYGAFLIAFETKHDLLGDRLESLKTNILTNLGLRGVQVPVHNNCGEPVSTLPEGVNETDENVKKNDDGTFQICTTEYTTKTPGFVVADLLNRTTGSGYDFGFVVDEIDEAIDAIITALINELINSVLDGIFNPKLASLPVSYSDPDSDVLSIITYGPLPQAENGVYYETELVAVHGALPYSWKIYSGALPQGLALSEDGIISGIPSTIPAIFSFTVLVEDNVGATDLQSLWMEVVEAGSGTDDNEENGKEEDEVVSANGCIPGSGTKTSGESCQFNTECCSGFCFDYNGQTELPLGTCSGTGGLQDEGGFCDASVTNGKCAAGLECVNNVCQLPENISAQNVSSKPILTKLSPSSGKIGDVVTIVGTNFSDQDTVYLDGYHVATLKSKNGTLSFTIPSLNCSDILVPKQNCGIPSPNPGDYRVSITNYKGTSNSLIFTVTVP